MLSRNLVLILGAGASKPYGFPLGGELTIHILQQIAPQAGWYFDNLVDLNCDPPGIRMFFDHFQDSMRYSIDTFLEHRKDLQTIGKLCIAQSLLSFERNAILGRTAEGHWYQYLIERLAMKPEQFENCRLSIITYNYDRSLEHYLLGSLRASFNLTTPDAAALVRCIPIVHLHGSLGDLPALYQNGNDFGATPTSATIRHAADGIQIVSDKVDSSPEFGRARELLQKAEVICFLGFSYNELSLGRLFLPGTHINGEIYGTSLGLMRNEIETVENWFMNFQTNIDLQPLDAYTALRTLPVLR